MILFILFLIKDIPIHLNFGVGSDDSRIMDNRDLNFMLCIPTGITFCYLALV